VLELTGMNTYTVPTYVNGGTLIVSKLADSGQASSLGAGTGAIVDFAQGSGAVLRYIGSGDSTNREIGQVIGGSPTLDSSGTGAVIFSSTTNPNFGATNQARIFILGGTNTDNNTLAANINRNNLTLRKYGIGTWVLTGSGIVTGGGTQLSGGGKLVLDYGTNNNAKISGVLTLGDATLGGAGTLTLAGGASADHVQVVTSTTLNAGGAFITREGANTAVLNMNAITRNVGGTISFESATLATTDRNNFGTSGANGILGGWATLGSHWAVSADTGAADTPITALASYTGLVTSGGVSTTNYQLVGGQTQAGATAVGSLRLENDANSQTLNIGDNNLTITSTNSSNVGGILYAGGNDNNYTISNGGGTGRILSSTGGQELIFHVHTGNLSVDAFVGASSGASTVTKSGAGTLEIGSNNAYTGTVRVNEGVLRLAHANATGTTAGGIIVQNNAALELANGVAIGAEALTLTGSGVSNGGALRNIANNTSSYAGAITLGAGGSRINSDANGALTLTGGIVTSLFNDVTFGGAGNTTVSTAAISGAGGLIKDGNGVLTLSAANTYTGATTVSQGTLIVNGSTAASSAVTVASGATLGGSGTINGAVTVDGSIAPGNSIGTLTTGAVTWNGANTAGTATDWKFELGADNDADLLSIVGDFTKDTTNGSNFRFDFLDSTDLGTFTLVSWTGITDFIADDFSQINYDGAIAGSFSITSASNGSLVFTAIPEPSSALVGLLIGAGLLRRRRSA